VGFFLLFWVGVFFFLGVFCGFLFLFFVLLRVWLVFWLCVFFGVVLVFFVFVFSFFFLVFFFPFRFCWWFAVVLFVFFFFFCGFFFFFWWPRSLISLTPGFSLAQSVAMSEAPFLFVLHVFLKQGFQFS